MISFIVVFMSIFRLYKGTLFPAMNNYLQNKKMVLKL